MACSRTVAILSRNVTSSLTSSHHSIYNCGTSLLNSSLHANNNNNINSIISVTQSSHSIQTLRSSIARITTSQFIQAAAATETQAATTATTGDINNTVVIDLTTNSSENKDETSTQFNYQPRWARHRDFYIPPTIESSHQRALSLYVARPYQDGLRRVGLVGRKIGMTQMWDEYGEQLPLTVIQIDECQVVQIKKEKDIKGLIGVQIGTHYRALKNIAKPQVGHYKKAGVPPKLKLVEFRASAEAAPPVGLVLNARHFLAGQFVDVTGTSAGKGFQGAMKRHGFSGQPATHGVSLAHRSVGSVGAKGVGHTFKGKKMPGRMGQDTVTVQNLQVYKIDVAKNLLFVRGAIPGKAGGIVKIKDAIKMMKQFNDKFAPPCPTFVSTSKDEDVKELIAPKGKVNPFTFHPA